MMTVKRRGELVGKHPIEITNGRVNYDSFTIQATKKNNLLFELSTLEPNLAAEVTAPSNTPRTPYRFTAKEADKESGRYDFGARYYDARTSVWQSPDPILGAYLNGTGRGPYISSNLALYSYARNNAILLKDPDGHFPILPLLLKAGATGAGDLMAQAAMNYYFGGAKSISQAFGNVNWWPVSSSAAEGLMPSRTAAGRLGRAAATAGGDVMGNALHAGSDYSQKQAIPDFATGFIGDLAGGGMGELVGKYGTRSVARGLCKIGFSYAKISKLMGNGLARINKTLNGVNSSRVMRGWNLGKMAVIGRNMGRVKNFANSIGGDVWKGFDENLSDLANLANNRKWVEGLKEQGYTIYDVGLDPHYSSLGDMSKGSYYGMETKEIFGD